MSNRTCSVPGCDRKYRCSGYCGVHYNRVRATGSPGPVELLQAPPSICKVEDCDRRAKFFGLCDMHHRRKKILEEVATNPARRINTWATNGERLHRIGWDEVMVRPDIGPCWEWRGDRDKRGYGRISVQGRKMRFAHRIAFQEWKGDLPDKTLVCHRCDNPACIRPEHLFPGDQHVNMGDAATKDRTAYGERQGRHKLKEAEVVAIRERYATTKDTFEDIAVQYGVCRQSIINVVKGKTWARAGGPIVTHDIRQDGRNAGRRTR